VQPSSFQPYLERLSREVPGSAARILVVEATSHHLAALLKRDVPSRVIWGTEIPSASSGRTLPYFDEILSVDAAVDEIPLPPGSIDCLLLGIALTRFADPTRVLRRLRGLLSQDGVLIYFVPDFSGHSVLAAQQRCVPSPQPGIPTDQSPVYALACQSVTRVLLDAGYAPALQSTITVADTQATPGLAAAMFDAIGTSVRDLHSFSGRNVYVFRGIPLLESADAGEPETPLTFVACVSNDAILQENLLSSPCLSSDSPHEVLLMRNCASAAEGYNRGIEVARNDIVVFVHQDVYLPSGWTARFLNQVQLADEQIGNVAVLGLYGVCAAPMRGRLSVGHVVDRNSLLRGSQQLPAVVDSLDELLLALRRPTQLRFDGRLGFHFYGADICQSAKQSGQKAVAIDAPCFHNSLNTGVSWEFYRSGKQFAKKWRQMLPIHTTCARVDCKWMLPLPRCWGWYVKFRQSLQKVWPRTS
jgi:hypothetical protein